MSRTIKADGKTFIVPDDATDDEINQIVGPAAPTHQAVPAQEGAIRSFADQLGVPDHLPSMSDVGHFLVDPRHGPGAMLLHGAMDYGKRVAGDAKDIRDLADNPDQKDRAGATAYHLLDMVPMLGPAELKAADQYGAGNKSGALGTVAGAALPAAATALGGLDMAAPNRSLVAPVKPAIQEAAIGDPDAAALRGLRVAPGGKKVIPMQDSVQTSRPYFKGASSLKDLQGRVGPAKAEAFKPYSDTIAAEYNTPVKGPDGMTTIGQLEEERQQLSAMNRGLKTGDPSALKLAEQKGLSQADALAREQVIKAHLDPALQRYGIDPQGIRRAYGAISRVGNQVEGRSTLLEKPVPSGLGKIGNISLKQPFQAPGQIASGIRDIAAGRPLFRMSPTDVGIREGFASAGPKPNFGQYTPFKPMGMLPVPPIELGAPPEIGGTPEGFRPPPFYHDTDAMRTGRLLPAPPIELPGGVKVEPPDFRFDTTPMRKGRLLPAPTIQMPLSGYHDIFPDQLPQGEIVRPKKGK